MYKGNGKLDRTHITRNKGYQGHKHMFIHTQEKGPPRQKVCLHPYSMQYQTPEERNPQIVTLSERRQTNLRWPSIHPHSRFNHIQTPLEHRPIHLRRKISYSRCQGLLPEQSNEGERIFTKQQSNSFPKR